MATPATIERVSRRSGMPFLGGPTPRQREILLTYAHTGTVKGAAHELGLSQQTVKTQLSEAYGRLGVESGIQAIYQLLDGDRLLGEHEQAMRRHLTEYVEAEWLTEAVRAAAHAAIEAMVETVDRRVYLATGPRRVADPE